MSFLCQAGSFVSGKDILVFHFSGKEQRQFLCRDLILDLFSVPRLAQAIALGNRLVLGKSVMRSRHWWGLLQKAGASGGTQQKANKAQERH